MKKIILVLILLSASMILLADIQTEMYDEAVRAFYADLVKNVDSTQVISVTPFENDPEQLFYSKLTDFLTREKHYKILIESESKKTFKENINYSDPVYKNDESPKQGVMKPARWLITGNIIYQNDRFLGKPTYLLKVKLNVNDIEKGTTVLSFFKNYEKKWAPSTMLLLTILIVAYVDLRIFNKLTKGYYAKKAFIVFIIILALILGWFFI